MLICLYLYLYEWFRPLALPTNNIEHTLNLLFVLPCEPHQICVINIFKYEVVFIVSLVYVFLGPWLPLSFPCLFKKVDSLLQCHIFPSKSA